ncbi:MAG: hypothetical protein BWY71_00256 [Planctomycetes bacterium ADurb.Bin412]|nr:MAG: hypothetical protein BWY71_00256 [Planctomycetes bacterium ADurb.Bin412]
MENFVKEQFEGIAQAADAGQLTASLQNLVENSRSSAPDAAAEARQNYSDAFTAAVQAGFQQVTASLNSSKNPNLAREIRYTSVVALAACDNVKIIPDLLALFDEESPSLRYWAVKGLNGNAITAAIRQASEDDSQWKTVLAGLTKQAARETDSEVISQLVSLATALSNHPEALDALPICTSRRIELYKNWTVDNELSDLELIQQLIDVAVSEAVRQMPQVQTNLIRSAAQLYTAAYYRYVLGIKYKVSEEETLNLLSPQSQAYLETVLIEGEVYFRNITDAPQKQSRFMKDIQDGDFEDFPKTYEQLFSNQGIVSRAFKLLQEGQTLLEPLPAPSEEIIEKARTRNAIETSSIGSNML